MCVHDDNILFIVLTSNVDKMFEKNAQTCR